MEEENVDKVDINIITTCLGLKYDNIEEINTYMNTFAIKN